MMHPIMQGLNQILSMFGFLFYLPWTIWDGLTKIIRSTVSLNGYTGINPDGVLQEKEVSKDDKSSDSAEEEGESKEENWGFELHR